MLHEQKDRELAEVEVGLLLNEWVGIARDTGIPISYLPIERVF